MVCRRSEWHKPEYMVRTTCIWQAIDFVLHTGLRTDMAGYSAGTSNPLKQLSPRIAMQYRTTDKLSINASSGIYYQLPNSVLLAFTDSTLRDGISWIRSPQVAIGADYRNADHYRVSLEVFIKV